MAWSGLSAFVIVAAVVGQADTPAPASVASQRTVRIGLVAFEDFRTEIDRYRRLFGEMSKSDPSLSFQLAVGTYGDVLHWIDREMVDAAILPPGVFAETLAVDEQGKRHAACDFLAAVRLPPATSPWAIAARRSDGYHDSYRVVCLVPLRSPLHTEQDLKKFAKTEDVEFLFVHPLSIAGYGAPIHVLNRLGLQTTSENSRFTYSHSESVRQAVQTDTGKHRVAFVWDDTALDDPSLPSSVRQLPFSALEALSVPPDVVVARAGFAGAERLKALLLDHVNAGGQHDFSTSADPLPRYQALREWNKKAVDLRMAENSQQVSLDEIGQILVQFARAQPIPPRLAVVLSGGGAKCAYQVGAVCALEQKLGELRKQNVLQGLDISLVVGTSGGAINALPIALGVTSTEEGRNDFCNVWSQLDQRDIVRPSLLVRANMGLWFALLQFALVQYLVRRRVKNVSRRGWVLGWTLLVLATIEIFLGTIPNTPWRWLGTNHAVHHLWLWATFGIHFSAIGLFVAATVVLAVCWKTGRREEPLFSRKLTATLFAVGLFGLPLLQVASILWYEQTLSSGEGMERAVAEKFPGLIDRQLVRSGADALEPAMASSARARLTAVSRQLIERKCLHRDLVITGSCLEQSSAALPSDLYFYASARGENHHPPFGTRGVALSQTPAILMDVVLGSGSIYPMFPPREVLDFPSYGESILLVDGGFAHNSPVEAAVLWGATHIVLIEASPKVRSPRNNFLQNAVASFDHLYEQAQLLDAHSRGQVVMFTLAPAAPHLCVLDFADNLITADIALGYGDAIARDGEGRSRFRKEFGRPTFIDVNARE